MCQRFFSPFLRHFQLFQTPEQESTQQQDKGRPETSIKYNLNEYFTYKLNTLGMVLFLCNFYVYL